MLREEQIDIRRQRARETRFDISNLGKNRVFSDYRVTNPTTGGEYTVTVRGFDVGDNACTCPDFRSNTLGTCKHVEAVLESLKDDAPEHVRRRKAAVTRPEVFLDYREPLRVGIHIPPRHSDQLTQLAARFFSPDGYWNGRHGYDELVAAIESVPEDVTVLSDAMDFIDRELERRDMTRREQELLAELDNDGERSPLRRLLKAPLYDFQARGAIFAACRGRSILGDEMGLGKTVQTMAAVEILAKERGIGRVLVIAPASVKYQWESEIRKFTDRPVQVVEGLKDDREEQYAEPTFYRLVNYEQVVRDLDALNAWKPDLVVLDEAQRIKNWESKTSRAVKKLRSRYALVLTGTPLENKLEELYSIVQFVDDRRLGPAFEFLHEHRVLDEQGNLVGYRNLDKIREKLAPILLRRTRAAVLTQLPERTDNTIWVELSEAQRQPYEDQRSSLARLLQKSFLTDLDRKRILACIVNMRMLCDSTFLFDKQTNISPKLDEFTEVIAELASEEGHKAVVFSQWEMMLAKAAEVLERLNVGYTVLHGKVPGRERRELLERFKQDGNCCVFLSTDAGGTGLNLQAADTVINLELPWNPAVLDQRIARVHRMGQSRPVRVINFVTRSTIEERVLKTIESKRTLFAGVFDGESDEVNFAALNRPSFLDGVRELIEEQSSVGSQQSAVAVQHPPTPVGGAVLPDARQAMLLSGVHLLEALAGWEGGLPWTDELRERARAALGRLLEQLGGFPASGTP
jgi:superfamily II DNA or RNA helicase